MLATFRPLLRAAGAALLAATVLSPPAAAAQAAPSGGACTDPDAVTVVVDSTELGGEVTVGCATDPASGTEALTQAGFAESRDPSGYICAVGGLPDPCPTEFTGSYWSYWSAGPDGEWTSYMEGSDTAVPEPGSVEGWRYGDGTQPPAVDAAAVLPGAAESDSATDADGADSADGAAQTPAEPATGDEAATDTAAQDDDANEGGTSSMPPAVAVAVGLAILAAIVATVVRLRRQSATTQQD